MANREEHFDMRVTDSRLSVMLDCTVNEEQFDKLVQRVHGGLRGLGVSEVPEPEELEQRLRDAIVETEEGPEVKEMVLVEGRPPKPPQEGRIEWAGDFFSEGFVVDEETGAINYRERRAKPNVEQGDLLATVYPPVPGEIGRDVFGKPIAASRPKPLRVRAGSGVRAEEDGKYYAEITGRVRFVGSVLAVDELFHIEGSVGLKTGHIEHLGAVEVAEDIETGASVKAAGDIQVGGIIEAADVECEGSLEVAGGITGMGKKPIKVAGRVQAKFILDASVVAGQDISVAREIMHSRIHSQSAVCSPNGRMVGGNIYGRKAIDTKQAGSDAVVPTFLSVGVTGDDAHRLAEMEKQLGQLRESAGKIRRTISPLASHLDALSGPKRKMTEQLIDKLAALDDAIARLESEREELRGHTRPQIVVRSIIFPETTFSIDYATMKVRESIAGPVRAVLSQGKVTLMPLRD